MILAYLYSTGMYGVCSGTKRGETSTGMYRYVERVRDSIRVCRSQTFKTKNKSALSIDNGAVDSSVPVPVLYPIRRNTGYILEQG